MGIILTADDEPRSNPSATILNFPPSLYGIGYLPEQISTKEEAAAILDCSPAHARAVAEGRSKRLEANAGDLRGEKPDRMPSKNDAQNDADCPVCAQSPRIVATDTSGSPSESHCPKSQLDNILSVRDEIEARKARATVRPVDGGTA